MARRLPGSMALVEQLGAKTRRLEREGRPVVNVFGARHGARDQRAGGHIDALLNVAASSSALSKTRMGSSSMLATNYFGPFLLTTCCVTGDRRRR